MWDRDPGGASARSPLRVEPQLAGSGQIVVWPGIRRHAGGQFVLSTSGFVPVNTAQTPDLVVLCGEYEDRRRREKRPARPDVESDRAGDEQYPFRGEARSAADV
jgi:hypothetical protein